MDKIETVETGRGVHSANAIKAKVIVLGDSKTGKTQLIRNLDSHRSSVDGQELDARKNDMFFTVVEFSAVDLDNATNEVYLKIWEHSIGISKQEEELACRGALICIITLDIRNAASAVSAFNKWIKLKETYMTECFLFVVGTHLDMSIQREVQIKDICKASAMSDATYVEVSNIELTNIGLLRRLIGQRLIYMLERRDVINSRMSVESITDDVDDYAYEEITGGDDHNNTSEYGNEGKENNNEDEHSGRANSRISIPALEQNVLSHSVGAILSSYLGTEHWPGFESQQENLMALGREMSAFVDQLAASSASENEKDYSAMTNTMHVDDSFYDFDSNSNATLQDATRKLKGGTNNRNKQRGRGSEDDTLGNVDAGHTLAELRMAFDIMGLSLPKSLSLVSTATQKDAELTFSYDNDDEQDGTNGSTPRKNKSMSYLRKMIVRLPDGSNADMVLDLESNIEQQIELFLLSNSMGDDDDARAKLVQTLYQIREEYYVSNGIHQPSSQQQSQQHQEVNDDSGGQHHHHHSQQETDTYSNNGSNVGSHSSSSRLGFTAAGGGNNAGGGGGASNNKPFVTRYKATKKCKLRISVPGIASGQIEVVVNKGEDLADTAETIRSQYRLSQDLKQKVYEQLIKAFH